MFPKMAAVALLELRLWRPALQSHTGNFEFVRNMFPYCLTIGTQKLWQWNCMAMFVAKFGWTFWPCLLRNPTSSSVVSPDCFEMFVRRFVWTLLFQVFFGSRFTWDFQQKTEKLIPGTKKNISNVFWTEGICRTETVCLVRRVMLWLFHSACLCSCWCPPGHREETLKAWGRTRSNCIGVFLRRSIHESRVRIFGGQG